MFLINGQLADLLPVQDRGLHYGDGIFETIAIDEGKPLCWDAHYQRLKSGCDRLKLTCPAVDLLRSEIQRLPLDHARYVLKIILTRGAGNRGYRVPAPDTAPTRILGLYPWPGYPPEYAVNGIKTRLCSCRLGQNPVLAGIKHLNRLEQVMARSEWDDPDIAEGLMLDTQGNVIEGTMSNLFCIRDNVLHTPDLSACGVAGVIRGCILDLAAWHGWQTTVCQLTEMNLYESAEIFVCNSVIGIWPVRQIDNKKFTAGPRSLEIRQALIQEGVIAA